MSDSFVSPLLQRTLSAVYRFYDVFYFPIGDATPPVVSPLEVSIPSLSWNAYRAADDYTYRFSSLTLTQPAPAGVNLAVDVTAPAGDYVSFEPIQLTLPRTLSVPVQRSDFLIPTPLWPTVAVRPPVGETAVRGQIQSAAALPVSGLKVEMWPGPAVTPPPGTPFTLSDASGQFLYRFPLLKGVSGSPTTFNIQLSNGAVAVSPASLAIPLGTTQVILFQRT
ncbi:MAG TPA: hypothetical protein VG297_00055 [Bryobacteraceae bacterium]|jgi:hypothetical protein|nr:hypothetical protein [Bryobacteraceae bacterium]